jgi:hypothetical protein
MYKREIKTTQIITIRNGKPAIQEICPVYGAKIFRIGKAQFL